MSVDSIRFKLNKYENKFKNENNAYKRALYAEKIGGYRNMMKGGTFAGVIEAGIDALDKDFRTFTDKLAQKKVQVANDFKISDDDKRDLERLSGLFNAVKEKVTTANTNIDTANTSIRTANTKINEANQFFQELETVKTSMINSASKFAEYNIKVRALLRNIIYEIEGMNVNLKLTEESKTLIDTLKGLVNDDTPNINNVTGLTELKILPLFKYMNFNSALMGLIGAFLGNDKNDGKRIVGQIRLLLETKYDERVDVSYGEERDADNGQYTDNIPTNWENWANMDANKHKVIYNEVIDKLIDVSTAVTRAPAAVARVPATASAADAAPAAKPKIPVNGDINAEIASVIKNTPNKLYNFNQIRKMIYLFCNVTDAGKKPNIETDSQYEELKTDIRGPTESSEA
jgi:hypothetical protein